MSDGFLGDVCYFLLIIVEFLLKIVHIAIQTVISVSGFCLQTVINVNMTETSKKRKRNNNEKPNQTVTNKSIIDANWQKLLSSSLIMDKKTEKPVQEDKKEHFTGTFRRARKKKVKAHETPQSVQNDLKTLKINTVADNLETTKPLENTKGNVETQKSKENNHKNKITKFIAMDCEMVGIGYEGNDHMLARVSLVNKFGDCIYDKFVKPREEVVDYRTDVSGVRREDMLNGEEFTKVRLLFRLWWAHSLHLASAIMWLNFWLFRIEPKMVRYVN